MRRFGWILRLVATAISLLAAAFSGVAAVAGAGRFFTECRDIPLADLQFTSDCEDALLIMIAGGVVGAFAAATMLALVFRRWSS